jgi:hypothetical protein
MSEFRMHRSNFGAWCVVSSPLILGHDLTDDHEMDKIWPIITNQHAINISQSFGDSRHPGGLVRTWSPSGSPSAAPNTTAQFVWALGDDPAATGGWTAVVGAAGPVRHRSAGAGVDLCLTVPVAGRQKGKVSLRGCVTPVPPSQTWMYETNGSLIHPAWQEPTKGGKKAHAATCLVLANGRGPSVELFQCKPGGNERFAYAAGNGTLCSATIGHPGKPPTRKCLSARNAGPGDNSGDGTCQLWAKPQPGGAVAVFFLNNMPPGAANVSATVALAELNYTHTGPSAVFDVWAGKPLPPLAAGATAIHTAAIGEQDSALLLVSPQQE